MRRISSYSYGQWMANWIGPGREYGNPSPASIHVPSSFSGYFRRKPRKRPDDDMTNCTLQGVIYALGAPEP